MDKIKAAEVIFKKNKLHGYFLKNKTRLLVDGIIEKIVEEPEALFLASNNRKIKWEELRNYADFKRIVTNCYKAVKKYKLDQYKKTP